MTISRLIALLSVAIALISCDRTPDGVIPRKEMASLMADIHTAESVVDTERRVFATDSMRLLLKQSVLARHGYTVADLDSSLSYYGRNIDIYAKLYDDVVEILEDRIATAEIEGLADNSSSQNNMSSDGDMSFDGDSVDVWSLPRTLFFSRTSPVSVLPFSLASDRYWEHGDVYTLRGKLSGATDAIAVALAVEYLDGSVDHLTMRSLGNGWKEATILVDSAKTARNVYGAISYPVAASGLRPVTVFDSITLYRSRHNPALMRDPRTRSVTLKQ